MFVLSDRTYICLIIKYLLLKNLFYTFHRLLHYRFKKLLKMTRRKLNECENGELSFHWDLKTSQTEMDIQINMLKHKVIFNQF